jgi:hypothetical protein
MNATTEQLVRSLLKKDSIQDCSVDELRNLAEKYTYFGPIQFLLLKKLEGIAPDLYAKQLQTTSLIFPHPLQLKYLLDGTGSFADVSDERTATEPDASSNENKPSEYSKGPAESVHMTEESGLTKSTNHAGQADISPPVASVSFQPQSNSPEEESVQKTDPLFEPFYTVDYFASQGIRMKEDEKPADRFGQQLKSFTEWLKILKRKPVTEIVKEVAPSAEHKVEVLADRSIEDREVVTEAMAEVWEKQGNIQKAIDIYNKLSLLEPPKSAYFAAKIEGLRKKN